MWQAIIAGIMGLALAIPVQAGDVFSLRFTAHPAAIVRGIPIEVRGEIRNVSGHPVKIVSDELVPGILGYAGDYFSFFARAEEANGTEVPPCQLGDVFHSDTGYFPRVIQVVLAADWQHRYQVPVCIDKVGLYKVALVARGQGPFIDRVTKKKIEAWSGEVASAAVPIWIEEPTGVDRAAYDYFKGDPLELGHQDFLGPVHRHDLLTKFPTSTYVAYDVWGRSGARRIASPDSKLALNELDLGQADVVAAPCDEDEPCRDMTGFSSLAGEHAIAWREKWLDMVLKAHPDIWFVEDLKLRLAVNRFLAQKPQLGAAELEQLANSGRPDIAEKAGQLLALVKQKGLVK